MNLVGQKFGRLIVIEKAPSKNGRGMWLCQCECGNIKTVRTDALKEGRTKSCGCLNKEKVVERTKRNLIGQVFGKLTVISETSKRNSARQIIWECSCECGNKIFLPTSSLTTGHTKSCGCMKSQGEYIIAKILSSNQILFEKEKTFDTCVFQESGAKAKFDFYVDNKYIIEFDGLQHKYAYGSGWFNLETHLKTVKHDNYKNNWCKENNIPLIRIPYIHLNKICLEDLLLETSQFII